MARGSQASAVYVRRHGDVIAERMHYEAFARQIPRHFHDAYQLSVCVGGHGTYRYHDGEQPSRSGSVQVFAPGDVHSYEHGDTAADGSIYRSLYLDPGTMGGVLESLHEGREPLAAIPSAVLSDPEVLERFVLLHDACLLGGPALERDSRLLALVTTQLERHERVRMALPRAGQEHRAVHRVKDLLRAHYARNVRLNELAALAELSRWRIHRAFTSAAGMPPHSYHRGPARSSVRTRAEPALLALPGDPRGARRVAGAASVILAFIAGWSRAERS